MNHLPLALLWFAGMSDADDGTLILSGEACQRGQEPLDGLTLHVAHSGRERPSHICASDWGSDPVFGFTTARRSSGDHNSGLERP
jgi:hypothetical protein